MFNRNELQGKSNQEGLFHARLSPQEAHVLSKASHNVTDIQTQPCTYVSSTSWVLAGGEADDFNEKDGAVLIV